MRDWEGEGEREREGKTRSMNVGGWEGEQINKEEVDLKVRPNFRILIFLKEHFHYFFFFS